MTLGERFKAARIRANLTQKQIADVCRDRYGNVMTNAAVSQWEQDKSIPTLENLIAACKRMGASADYILGLSSTHDMAYKLSKEAVDHAEDWDNLTESQKLTVGRCMKWVKNLEKSRRPVTGAELIRQILDDKTILK